MAINNVFDLYNATLNADQPIVTTIVTAILSQLETSVTNNISTFDFDLTPYTSTLPSVQQNRIIDRVLATLRDNGIHARVKSAPLTPPDPSLSYPYYSNYFNNISTALNIITITWYTRNAQERFKTYV